MRKIRSKRRNLRFVRPRCIRIKWEGGRLDSVRRTGPDDWFRREMEEALARDRVLVPVHTPEFDFDEIDLYLPEETAEWLRRFQMLEISPWYFKYAIRRTGSWSPNRSRRKGAKADFIQALRLLDTDADGISGRYKESGLMLDEVHGPVRRGQVG